ncbi:rhodanese-related sulfurtransferase [Neolewinella xylanilytica]|uniref:Rhodanese-related sulfurtransferase n=1 Tax=Neolewinella xylanilytica TaxID=1514080 RepID=A0A2S6I8G0_9BACT|nr:rhodanese-like domain-containing protein [Neolewinella xylanilytica]PPK87784.1 rhodanese-related sulfurtransferase [Neolewinella xylanilytica]
MEATVEELKKREKEGKNDYVLLDVREDYERTEFNVGGIHVPLGQLSMSMDKLTPYKEQEIIIYCRSGKRSAMAQELLRQSGFKNVRNLEGGMLAYQK